MVSAGVCSSMIIYKATNKINGMVYIGCTTKSLERRVACYNSAYKSNKKIIHSFILKMREFKFSDFMFEQIDYANSVGELHEKEIFWIARYDSLNDKYGYNISPGGNTCSDNTKIRMGKSQKGKIISKEIREKTSKTLMGHTVSEQTRTKMSVQRKGKASWNAGLVGVCKSNSGSFSADKPAPNKGRKRMIIDGKIKFMKPELL